MRKILKIVGSIILVLILIVMLTKLWADKTYFNEYDPDLPFNVQMEGSTTIHEPFEFYGVHRVKHFEEILFTIDARPNEPMPVLLTLPVRRSGKLPAIVFLHGIGQGKGFVREICTPFTNAGFAMVSFDQHMRGPRRVEGNPFKQVLAFRQRPWKTVNDARRLIDYLQTHPEIDPERIYLVGASYGAITGTSLTAFEDRIRAAVLVVGGGNIPVMLNAPMIRDGVNNAALHWIARTFVSWLMRPADPIHYGHLTEGTPVLMQSGSEDILVTPEAGEELYNSLGSPKEIRWYPCDHPRNREEDAPIIVQILDEALEWLLEIDSIHRNDVPVVDDAVSETLQEEAYPESPPLEDADEDDFGDDEEEDDDNVEADAPDSSDEMEAAA